MERPVKGSIRPTKKRMWTLKDSLWPVKRGILLIESENISNSPFNRSYTPFINRICFSQPFYSPSQAVQFHDSPNSGRIFPLIGSYVHPCSIFRRAIYSLLQGRILHSTRTVPILYKEIGKLFPSSNFSQNIPLLQNCFKKHIPKRKINEKSFKNCSQPFKKKKKYLQQSHSSKNPKNQQPTLNINLKTFHVAPSSYKKYKEKT